MMSYPLSLMVVVVDLLGMDLVFLAGKPAGSTETLYIELNTENNVVCGSHRGNCSWRLV